VSGCTGCVQTHQVLGTLWRNPVSAHTAPNAKHTGNGNSDAARHGTVYPDADRHGICLPDGAWQSIFLLDALCQGIFLLDAAVSGHFPSGRSRVRAFSYWTRPDDACHGSTVTLAVKAQNVAANTGVAFANTQRVLGIVTQSSSILYIYGMYIYICYYTLRVSSKSTQRHNHCRGHHMQYCCFDTRSIALRVGNKGKSANTTRRDEHDDYEEDGDEDTSG